MEVALKLDRHIIISGDQNFDQNLTICNNWNTSNIIVRAPDQFLDIENINSTFVSKVFKSFYDDTGYFSLSRATPKNTLLEIKVPKGKCLQNLDFSEKDIEYFILYSNKNKAKLRYLFYLKSHLKFKLTGIRVDDVNNIFDELIKASINVHKRKSIFEQSLKSNSSKVVHVEDTKEPPAIELLQNHFDKFLTYCFSGSYITDQQVFDALKKINSQYLNLHPSGTYHKKHYMIKTDGSVNTSNLAKELQHFYKLIFPNKKYRGTGESNLIKNLFPQYQ